MRLKKLQEEIQMKGFNYKLIERTDKKALYARHDINTNLIHGYEVIKIQTVVSKPFQVGNNYELYDMIEKFPSTQFQGRKSWLYADLSLAKKKYDNL